VWPGKAVSDDRPRQSKNPAASGPLECRLIVPPKR
jgi:hypothetical protein